MPSYLDERIEAFLSWAEVSLEFYSFKIVVIFCKEYDSNHAFKLGLSALIIVFDYFLSFE